MFASSEETILLSKKISKKKHLIHTAQEHAKLQPTQKTKNLKQSLLNNSQHFLLNDSATSKFDTEVLNPCIVLENTEKQSLSRLVDPAEIDKFPEIPTITLSKENIVNPIALLGCLQKIGIEDVGAIKINLPVEAPLFKEFVDPKEKIDIRIQNIQSLPKGKPYIFINDHCTIPEYKQRSKKFIEEYIFKNPCSLNDPIKRNEYEFLSILDNDLYTSSPINVEYAPDLEVSKYGSGFNQNLDPQNLEEKDSYNLNYLYAAKNSLFQFLKNNKDEHLSGITSPWIYFGSLFASFAWHCEDMHLHSINYMHKGAPKTWYFIPNKDRSAFEAYFYEKFKRETKKRPELLYNLFAFISPLELKKNNIKVFKVHQFPGDYIISLPGVYHAGFSHGCNMSESVNFCAPSWIPYAYAAYEDYGKHSFMKKISFPISWIILRNAIEIEKYSFDENNLKILYHELNRLVKTELEQRQIIHNNYSARLKLEKVQDKTVYDRFKCHVCGNYLYLSYLSCKKCKSMCCTSHITPCACTNQSIIFSFQYSREELLNAREKLANIINNYS